MGCMGVFFDTVSLVFVSMLIYKRFHIYIFIYILKI